jgi:6-phosphogluconolactonase
LLSDERYLPEDNIRSNARLIAKHLIQKKASVARMIGFYNKNLSEEEFVIKYESQMSTLLPINVSILGMGEDMHTASLFPDSDELLDALKSDNTLHVVRPKSQPEARISLSGKALASAHKTYILILGENKLNAYKKACSEKTEINAPIRVVFGSNTSVFWADKI